MGSAPHFSRTLPSRCQVLLNELYEANLPTAPDSDHRLKATFLLSVAMPMVIFPMERIAKHAAGTASGHINDAPLDQPLADKVKAAFGGSPENSGLFARGNWAIHRHDIKAAGVLGLSGGLPERIALALADPKAEALDAGYSAGRLCEIIRNGLAHGGVMFLDEDGRTAEAKPVTKFCFVSLDGRGVSEYLFLRVAMGDFREFLKRWSTWLDENDVGGAGDDPFAVEGTAVA